MRLKNENETANVYEWKIEAHFACNMFWLRLNKIEMANSTSDMAK